MKMTTIGIRLTSVALKRPITDHQWFVVCPRVVKRGRTGLKLECRKVYVLKSCLVT